jgi:hypothetical protein
MAATPVVVRVTSCLGRSIGQTPVVLPSFHTRLSLGHRQAWHGVLVSEVWPRLVGSGLMSVRRSLPCRSLRTPLFLTSSLVEHWPPRSKMADDTPIVLDQGTGFVKAGYAGASASQTLDDSSPL